MERREYLLKPFEQEKKYMERRVAEGVEARKADARLKVLHRDGTPVSGAHIQASQTKHAFLHGTNVFMLDEMETPEKNLAYREDFARVFNLATLPFYWSDLEPRPGALRFTKDSEKVYRRPTPDLCLEYCREKDITPKLHCLNYDQWTPTWVDHNNVAEVKRLLEKRFAEIAARYAGQIHCMEVINETLLWYDEWKDQGRWSTQFFFEDDLVEWSFQCARKYFPQNELIINEATEQAWDVHAAGRSAYSAVISDSIRKGAVIDGIGLQYHLFYSKEREAEQACPLLSPKRLYGCMDHYWNRYHKPLQVTEVTIPAYSNSAEDEALQAEVLEKLFTIWFSHPAMEAAIYWNLVDGYAAFAPQGDMTAGENYYHGGLIRFDMTHKPAYDMMNELFHHRFRTEADGQTDDRGCAAFRGFEGDYELTVEKNDHSAKTPFTLRRDGGEVEIRLED